MTGKSGTGVSPVSYSYDAARNLKSCAYGSGRTNFYYYDHARRLVKETHTCTGVTEISWFYVYEGLDVVAKVDNLSGDMIYFSRGLGIAPGVGDVLAESHIASNGSLKYTYVYVQNHRGDTIALVSNSTVVARYEYSAWGMITSNTGVSAFFTFSGKHYDSDAGLYYYGFRWYDPQAKRWTQPDPSGLAEGLDLYQFCGNDPINGVDSRGRDVYAVYRRFDNPVYEHGYKVIGHIYLQFTDEHMGNKWRDSTTHNNFKQTGQTIEQNGRFEYQDMITMSFHPWSVHESGVGDIIGNVKTEGSWVEINDIAHDIEPIAEGRVDRALITADEDQQISLFEFAVKSALKNRQSMKDVDPEPYSLLLFNCGSWVKYCIKGAHLPVPCELNLWNVFGIGMGGPMDYTGLPQLTYGVLDTLNWTFGSEAVPDPRTYITLEWTEGEK